MIGISSPCSSNATANKPGTVFVLFKTKEDLKIYKKKLSFSKKDYWIQYSHLIL